MISRWRRVCYFLLRVENEIFPSIKRRAAVSLSLLGFFILRKHSSRKRRQNLLEFQVDFKSAKLWKLDANFQRRHPTQWWHKNFSLQSSKALKVLHRATANALFTFRWFVFKYFVTVRKISRVVNKGLKWQETEHFHFKFPMMNDGMQK